MNILGVEHIGIAVKSLSDSIPVYERLLGTPCYKIEFVEEEAVTTAFFKVGNTKIELLEATNGEGVIGDFVSGSGEGVHHIAFSVDNASEALLTAKAEGFRPIDRTPRAGAEGMRIGFLNPKKTAGVLVELCSVLET